MPDANDQRIAAEGAPCHDRHALASNEPDLLEPVGPFRCMCRCAHRTDKRRLAERRRIERSGPRNSHGDDAGFSEKSSSPTGQSCRSHLFRHWFFPESLALAMRESEHRACPLFGWLTAVHGIGGGYAYARGFDWLAYYHGAAVLRIIVILTVTTPPDIWSGNRAILN